MYTERPTTRIEYLSAEQLAERLQVDKRTVYRWKRAGKVSAIELSPRTFRFEFPGCLDGLRDDGGQTVIM